MYAANGDGKEEEEALSRRQIDGGREEEEISVTPLEEGGMARGRHTTTYTGGENVPRFDEFFARTKKILEKELETVAFSIS